MSMHKRNRMIWMCFDILGFRQKEIANWLGLSEGRVKHIILEYRKNFK